MTLTPAMKGQLTKAVKATTEQANRYASVRKIFSKHMPAEQAKHATRRFLANV